MVVVVHAVNVVADCSRSRHTTVGYSLLYYLTTRAAQGSDDCGQTDTASHHWVSWQQSPEASDRIHFTHGRDATFSRHSTSLPFNESISINPQP